MASMELITLMYKALLSSSGPDSIAKNSRGGTLENNSSVEHYSGGTLENNSSVENNSGGTLEN